MCGKIRFWRREMKKVGILISGRGSNMVALLEAIKERKIPCEPQIVISNVIDAPGLEKAREFGVKTVVINHKESKTREEHDKKMIDALNDEGVDIVCLAGYMRLLSSMFVQSFKNRILNIHPALLPSFPGLNVQKKAIDAGVRFSGCTVHIVDELCDHGAILLQAVVPIFPDDTDETLSKRILRYEHRTYPLALKLFAEDKFKIDGNRALLNVSRDEYEEIAKTLMWNGD
jgi:phosphoribosylglycinamide formyltransferase-1